MCIIVSNSNISKRAYMHLRMGENSNSVNFPAWNVETSTGIMTPKRV